MEWGMENGALRMENGERSAVSLSFFRTMNVEAARDSYLPL